MRRIFSIALGTLLVAGAGCAANPLIGDWTHTASSTEPYSTSLHIAADGSATLTMVGTTVCSGSMTYTGIAWTASATTITLSGATQCTGMITCTSSGTSVPINCTNGLGQAIVGGMCSYVLDSNNEALVLGRCSGGTATSDTTFARNSSM